MADFEMTNDNNIDDTCIDDDDYDVKTSFIKNNQKQNTEDAVGGDIV